MVFLYLSKWLRKIKFDRVLPLLPGVRWENKPHDTLVVDKKIARLFAKQFFHLLGYRSKSMGSNHLIVRNRETASKKKEYPMQDWSLVKH